MILSWLSSKFARIGIGVATVAALVGMFAYDQQKVGARKVEDKSRAEAKIRNVKSKQIRQKAKEPGAAARLLRDYCRDC